MIKHILVIWLISHATWIWMMASGLPVTLVILVIIAVVYKIRNRIDVNRTKRPQRKDSEIMYSKLILPNQLVQDIEFLHAKDFYAMSFLGNDYEIIAKDDVGNYIGMAPNQRVFYLETASDTHLDNIRYISRDIEAFIQELNLYKQYSDDYFLEENPSDKALKEYADGFKALVVAIEPDAFCDSESYWSVIAEQMEYGQI